MKFYSEKLNKVFDKVEDLEQAENALVEAEKKKEILKAQREERAKEVEEAFNAVKEAQAHADEVLSKFCRDYGSYHKSYHNSTDLPHFFNFLSNLPF